MSDNGKFVRLLDPSSGQVEKVAPEAALPALQSGTRQLVADDQVSLAHQDGTTAMVPAGEVEKMVGQGWRFANRHDVLAGAAQSVTAQARGAAEGALSQLTFGASDYAMKQAGVEGLAERRDTTGGAIGDALGLGLTLAGPGLVARAGEGLAATALKTALAPSMALDGAAALVEKGAADALGSVITNRAVSGALATGLGHATVNAGYGFAGALSEESLGDANVNAEHLLAGAGMGALVGVGMGAVGGGLRGMLEARASKRAITALTAEEGASVIKAAGYEVSDKAAQGIWAKARRALAQASEAVGYDPEKIAVLNTPYARKVMNDTEGAVERAGRGLKEAVEHVEANRVSNVDKIYEKRAVDIGKLMPEGAQNSVVARAGDVVNELRAKLDAFAHDPELGLTEAAAASQVAAKHRLLDGLEADIYRAAKVPRGGSVEAPHGLVELANRAAGLPQEVSQRVFEKLNNVKQLLAEDAKFAGKVDEAGARARAEKYKDMYGLVRDHLEDASVYGRAADFQRETNAAFAAASDAQWELRKAFGGQEFTSKNVASYLANLPKFRGDDAVESLSKWRDAQAAYAEVVDRWLPGAGIAEKSKKALDIYHAAHAEASDAVGVKSALDGLFKQRNKLLGFQGQGMLGPLLGGAAGAALGPIGAGAAIAGSVLAKAVLDPGRFAQSVASAGRMREKVGAWLGNRAGRLAGVELPELKEAFPRAVSRTTRAILDAKSTEARREAYDARVSELTDLARNFPGHASQQLMGVSDKLPRHAEGMTVTGARAIQIILAHIPAPQPGTQANIYKSPRPHDMDIHEFARVDAAIQDPLGVLDRASRGEAVSTKELEAVALAYPALIGGFRQSVQAQIGASARRPSYKLQRAQNVVMGMPSADPAKMRSWQSLFANSAPPAPSPTGTAGVRGKSPMPSRAPMSASFERYPRQ